MADDVMCVRLLCGKCLSVLLILTVLFTVIESVSDISEFQESQRICTHTESVPELITFTVQVSFTERYTPDCSTWSKFWSWLTRKCKDRYRVSYRPEVRQKELTRYRKTRRCCSGWNSSTNCTEPLCSPTCMHGTCAEPYTCVCDAGWTGGSCESRCPAGTHGAGCGRPCDCLAGGSAGCDHVTGACRCRAGYTGSRCEKPCPVGFYGNNCSSVCDDCGNGSCERTSGMCTCDTGFSGVSCQEECREADPTCGHISCDCVVGQGECNPYTGMCRCFDGYVGEKCEDACHSPTATYGPQCSLPCQCRNSSSCDHVTGECLCLAGYSGDRCDIPCQKGYFGVNCSQTCTCIHFDECHPLTGTCSCSEGYMGEDCNEMCEEGFYGPGCRENCTCANDATCDHVTGVCNCTAGWQGRRCDLPCPDFFYGYHCRHQCECEHGASCDPVRGECMCTAGWHGNTCQLSCDEGTYGIGCTQPCDCINTDVCDPIDGTCICIGATGPNCTDRCEPLYYGNNCSEPCICQPDHSASCDPVIGKCVCTHPWSGSNCTECVRGRYGQECELICNCGSVSCDGFTGECICPSGTQGPDCNATCLSGFWGKQCRGRCAERCVHASTCHHVSGECACAPGWMGETCEQGCDVGRYGAGCVHECQCENEGSCDSATGACNCSISWSGQRCEIFAMAERDADPDEQKGALPIAVACVIGAAAIVVVILIVMVVYRRRKAAVTKQKNGDIELRSISSDASQNAPNGHAPPGPSGELPSKRRRRNRKASVEPGYKYNNPNYEQHVGSVSSSSTRPHRANSAPHRMNRGSASTTGTGNVSMSGNPIYYHSSSGSRVSDSDTDSTEHTPLTTAPPGTVIFNPLAEMSDGSPARPPDNAAHPLPPLPSNAYEYVSPPVDNRLPTLSADRPSPRPAPPPPPLEAEGREEEEEDDEGMYSVVGEWRGIVSDDPPLPPAEEEEEEEDGVVYADIEDVPARAWNGDAAIEGATSGDEYDTLDLTTRQKRSVVSSGALSTASPPNIYGRLSGPGGGGSGHWSEASSQRRPSSNTSDPGSPPLPPARPPAQLPENEYAEVEYAPTQADDDAAVGVGNSMFYDGQSEKPEQTYEYIDPNDVKLPTKPPASPKKLPRPQKLPRSKKPSGDSDKGGAGSLPRPTPQARTYVKCPISPELPPRPRALLRAPPVDTSNRESNIYAEIPEGIIGVGLHDGTRSGDSDVTPASVDNRLSHISSGTSSVNPGDRLSQLSSGSSSVNPGDRLSQLSSGSSSVNSGDRLSQISSSSSSVNPGHSRSSRSGSLSPHPPAFTESQLSGKWPPPRLPEKQGGRALSAASREEIGEEEEEEGEAPVLYDVPRTASVHSAGEQRETSDEDSRLRHSAPASAASTHLDDIPETPCSDGGATASKPRDEATLAYGGATADAFDDSVGIYANSQASASGQLYDVPRTQRRGGRANVTRM